MRFLEIIETLTEDLQIIPERPETLKPMELISSLVNEENSSPLIDWLLKNTEQDMEAMGKILQGTLLEAYGKLGVSEYFGFLFWFNFIFSFFIHRSVADIEDSDCPFSEKRIQNLQGTSSNSAWLGAAI